MACEDVERRAVAEDDRLWTLGLIEKAVETALQKLGAMMPSRGVVKGAVLKAVDETDTPHRTTPGVPPQPRGEAQALRRWGVEVAARNGGDSPEEVIARAAMLVGYVQEG